MRSKMTMLNLRPQDKLGGDNGAFDGINNTADCEFGLQKPIHLKDEGRFYLRSAFFPLTFKNVVEGVNDRFIIRFRRTVGDSDDDSIFVLIQIPSGQYDTLSALATAINAELGALNGTLSGTTFNRNGLGGGAVNMYGSDASEQTRAILSSGMTCAVSTDAQSKDHLVFTIADNVVMASSSIETKDGGTHADTTLTSFSLLFRSPGGSPVADITNRSANKLLGFGDEVKLDTVGRFSRNVGDTIVNGGPRTETARTSAGSTPDEIFVRSATLGNTLFTPYIYIRCDLARSTIETRPGGTSRQTDLIGKIPLSSSGYGDVLFYESDNNPLYFPLAEGTIQNVRITMTDSDGRLLTLDENEWEVSLVFEGIQD
jgi:hypothetical protein